MSGMRERAAVALLSKNHPVLLWEGADDDDREWYRDEAAVVLAVVAEVDEIAGVLAGHSPRDGSSFDGYLITCDCDNNTAYTRGTHARHVAEAVAAYILDQS